MTDVYVCVCSQITESEIDSVISIHGCKAPAEIFPHCDAAPRCCTCFPRMDEMIKEQPENLKSIDDVPIRLIRKLKDELMPSLPHIWREKVEDSKITFYKGQNAVIIGIENNQIVVTGDVKGLNIDAIETWVKKYTSIL